MIHSSNHASLLQKIDEALKGYIINYHVHIGSHLDYFLWNYVVLHSYYGLNVSNGLDLKVATCIYACPNHTDDGIHQDHGYLDTGITLQDHPKTTHYILHVFYHLWAIPLDLYSFSNIDCMCNICRILEYIVFNSNRNCFHGDDEHQ